MSLATAEHRARRAGGTSWLPEICGLEVELRTPAQILRAACGVSFAVAPGETFAIVGGSGSGKTVSVMALMRLLQSPPAQIRADAMLFEGRDLQTVPRRDWWRCSGEQIATVFQHALTALNRRCAGGWQIAEMIRVHRDCTRRDIRDRSIELLRQGVARHAVAGDPAKVGA